jgi:hypothetical protein
MKSFGGHDFLVSRSKEWSHDFPLYFLDIIQVYSRLLHATTAGN